MKGFLCWVHFLCFYVHLVSACMDLYKPSLFFFFLFFFSSWDECKLRHLKRGWDLMYQIIIDFKDPKA